MPNIVRFGEYYCLFVSVEQKNHLNLNTFIRCEEMKKSLKSLTYMNISELEFEC
ncbi:hypothetical protein SF285071_3563 [Shigella flexneri 2850-71]|nr:hypothetical protein SF285071_3563 [Shigella flexneri 2850-71]